MQTAQPLAERIHRRVGIEPRLIDRDIGQWAGHAGSRGTRAVRHHRRCARCRAQAVGVTSRAVAVLNEQLDRLRDGLIVLVTHQAVSQLSLYALAPDLGDPDEIRQRTGYWNVIIRCKNRWRVTHVDQRP